MNRPALAHPPKGAWGDAQSFRCHLYRDQRIRGFRLAFSEGLGQRGGSSEDLLHALVYPLLQRNHTIAQFLIHNLKNEMSVHAPQKLGPGTYGDAQGAVVASLEA